MKTAHTTIMLTTMTSSYELGDTTACFALRNIIQTECDWNGVTISQLRSSDRSQRMSRVRQAVIRNAAEMGYTHAEIGEAINRSRSTVSHLARIAK